MRKILALAALFAVGLFFAAGQAHAQTPAPAAGEQTCLKCHSDAKVNPILQTPHAVKGDAHTPFAQQGCESCHGASPDHIARKVKFPAVVFKGPNISPVAVRNQQCLTCHQSGLRMNWQGSQHDNSDVACTDCHAVHVQKDPVLKKITQPDVCFTCHTSQRAQSARFSHHPIREGKVSCSDCHNPHGSPGPTLLKEVTINQVCYNCHAEKRGPLLREHPPVRENCLNCHVPHGSAQPRLLMQRPPYLCQNCHDGAYHPGEAYSAQNLQGKTSSGSITTRFQMIGRSCLNCHSQVHGSNSPSGLYNLR
jgi:DmsE family decaheme c-type cytochrome